MNVLVARKVGQTDVAPLGKVIKRGALDVVAPARSLLSEIQKHGEDIYRDAFERGRAAGETEGERAAAALLAETTFAIRNYLQGSEQRLADIVLLALRRIAGQLDIDDLVAGMVRQLVAEALDQAKIRLRVAPAHHRKVRSLTDALVAEQPAIASIEVTADATLPEGTCAMETEAGSLQTGIDAQIEALRSAIEKHLSGERQP